MLYYWLKVGHLVFVIFWMAGLFMLPRFYIYHMEATSEEERARWVEREARLRRIIMTPSMVLVWVLGLALAFSIDAWSMGWFHLKLLLVFGLSGYHGWMVALGRKIAAGDAGISNKQMRLLNEVPGIAAILIVTTVVVGRLYF